MFYCFLNTGAFNFRTSGILLRRRPTAYLTPDTEKRTPNTGLAHIVYTMGVVTTLPGSPPTHPWSHGAS